MKNILSILLFLGLISCSGSKKTAAEGEQAGIQLADSDEFINLENSDVVAGNLEGGQVGAEAANQDEFATVESPEVVTGNSEVPSSNDSVENQTGIQMDPGLPQVSMSGEVGVYNVQKNETLMMISFKLFGDYGKWRQIAEMNQETLRGSHSVSEGMQLKYNKPEQEFVWSPQGNPYLIKNGDTLGIISNTTYGTTKYWKNIWQNNVPLIKDPNKIFAGFTIYTPEIEGREVANKELSDL